MQEGHENPTKYIWHMMVSLSIKVFFTILEFIVKGCGLHDEFS